MKVFLLDLWLDLKEKRLHYLAFILVAALVAVPLVLAKGSKGPAPQPLTTASAVPSSPVTQSSTDAGAVDSKLQTFSPRDPFEPTIKAPTKATGTGTSTTKTTTKTTTTKTASGGRGTSTGTTTTPSGGGTTTTPSGGGTTPQQKTIVYTYTVDIRFGPRGNQKLMKGVQRLELIPDQANPRIVFLGVTTSGKTAAFLVDGNLSVQTDGKCKPSPGQCTFLYLRPDGTHATAVLTDQNGNTWRLHLLKIHRVAVSSANGTSGSGTSGSGKSGSGKTRSPAFTGRAGWAPGDSNSPSPGGEAAQPFSFRGFFGDESSSSAASGKSSDQSTRTGAQPSPSSGQ